MLTVLKGSIQGNDVFVLQLTVYPDLSLHLRSIVLVCYRLTGSLFAHVMKSPLSPALAVMDIVVCFHTWYQLSSDSRAFL